MLTNKMENDGHRGSEGHFRPDQVTRTTEKETGEVKHDELFSNRRISQ